MPQETFIPWYIAIPSSLTMFGIWWTMVLVQGNKIKKGLKK